MAPVLFRRAPCEQSDAKSILRISYLLYPKTRKEQLGKEMGHPGFMPLAISWQNHGHVEPFRRP